MMKIFSFMLLLLCCSFTISTFPPRVQVGNASYYGVKKFHMRKTASGELMHRDSMTAAHRTYAFGTRVKVTNLKNNKWVIVRINDRGPRSKSRVIDLSVAAARKLDMIQAGIVKVKVETILNLKEIQDSIPTSK
ncbi:MAG: septal ring lytic transglycosylase RlpA family protein [Bacteroidia bacterium]|jgi:rare lipoprotein A|nr:septal ring lytic transglycosylase RlpA family protein [Bacteroidia bacterium]MBP9179269.1 septal ring lytic transglycosylase RlpA family protein [Bacteroidia bacterium]